MRVLVTGASRGIGAAIAATFARRGGEGTVVSLLARSHPRPSHAALEGTLLDTVGDVEAHGACGLPFRADATRPEEFVGALKTAVRVMGGLDVLINNASALHLSRDASPKHMDLLFQVNARATLLAIQTCREALRESPAGSVVTLAPPLRTSELDWIASHPAYTISKYSMTLATLAASESSVRSNCLWPRYTVATSATRHLEMTAGAKGAYTLGRDPRDVAEAVYALATGTDHNARTLFDDEVVPLPPCRAPLDLFATEDTRRMRRDP